MEIYLHIGHPKSGSTFLQFHFFNSIGENYIGRPYSKEFFKIEKIIATSDDNIYKIKELQILKFFENKLQKNQKNIISIEDLTKPTFLNQRNGHDIFRCLKRYNNILSNFGNVKVIYVIRSHSELICSFYEQFYLEDWKYYNITHKKIINFFLHNQYKNELGFLFDSFRFCKNYEKIINIFGKNEVKILFYEDLDDDYLLFKNEIFSFINLKKNIFPEKKIINSSSEKKSYISLMLKIFKYIIKNNFKILLNLKKELVLFYSKVNDIKFRKNVLSKYKKDIKNIDEHIRDFYKDDCLKFKNDSLIRKLKKYNYL